MTAHLAQLTTEYCFQLRKQLPQSAFSILYEAVADPLPTICSGSRILDHDILLLIKSIVIIPIVSLAVFIITWI